MSHEQEHLLTLAARIADGSPVNWDDEEASASDPGARMAIRKLRNLAAIASFHGSDPGVSRARDAAVAASTPDVPPDRIWGPLRLVERIGGGATCEVWLAWDPGLERHVALKLLRSGDASRVRAIHEGRLLARLRHPNVIVVHGAEEHDGRVGLWMELVEGRTLEDILLDHGTFGGREAALLGIEVCRALAAVHHAGLVHGDVKAVNVMRAEGGRIVLMDFGCGLASAIGADPSARVISGTPLYLAPERFSGGSATPRTDLYALGVLLFHLVTNRFPVEGMTLGEIRERHARGERVLLQDVRHDLQDSFVRALDRALAVDPRARFATAGEMERALAFVVGGDRLPLSTEILLRARSGLHTPGSLALVLGLGLAGILAIVLVVELLLH